MSEKATQLAYPGAPDEAKYHDGKPTPAYKASLERAYPNRSGWGQPSKDGASCDVFVVTVLVDSGVDKDFPRGYKDQKTRLASKTDLYECVVSTTSRDIKESELQFYLRQLTMGVLIFRSDKDFSFTGDEQRFLDTCREEYEFKLEESVDGLS